MRSKGSFATLFYSQPFWVTVVVAALVCGMSFGVDAFGSADNLYNISRNLAFIALIALGQNVVIITGGIDLSVGSVMALSGMVTALTLGSGYPIEVSISLGLFVAALCGLINGVLISRLKLSPFVVTLGMMSIARSLALVVSNNRTLYQLGPDEKLFLSIGSESFLGLSTPLLVTLSLSVLLALMLRFTRWGRHLYSVGGNEEAAILAGVPVSRIKISAYVLSSLAAGVAAILTVSWMGSASSALGTGMELQVIAASVIGGAVLLGGYGGAYGAVAGAALIEVIRNSLLLAGVDPYWQGAFVGCFIVGALALQRLRGGVNV